MKVVWPPFTADPIYPGPMLGARLAPSRHAAMSFASLPVLLGIRRSGSGSAVKCLRVGLCRPRLSHLWVPKPWLFQTWLLAFFTPKSSFPLFYAILRSFALFCGLAFALFCAHLRSFVLLCVFLRMMAFRTTAFGNCRLIQWHWYPAHA